MGVHPLMKTKNWPTPGVKKTVRGWPPGAKHPGEKNFWPPGEAIFFAFFSKITPRCSTKTRRRKKFFTPRWRRRRKNFSAAEGGRKIFFEPPPGVHPHLVPKPVPTYETVGVNNRCHLKMFLANYNIDLFDSFANELHSECHIWMNFYKCDPNQNTFKS